MPSTRARISTCRELSVWASHSNVIGTSRGSTLTAVTSIVWIGATPVFSFLQATTRSVQARIVTSAIEPSDRIEIAFISKSCQRLSPIESWPGEAISYDKFLNGYSQVGVSDLIT